jgi:hypothetical protein
MVHDGRALMPEHRLGLRIAAAAAVVALAAPAAAERSRSTSIAQKNCRKSVVVKGDESDYTVSRVCPGRGGYVVVVDEDDLRETLSFGKSAAAARQEPAAADVYGALNGYNDTVEWRSLKGRAPFAAIVSWSFADRDNTEPNGRPKSARFLVVMRLPPGPVCKVAYVERDANPDADALARKAADDLARGFNCGTDTVHIVGARGHGSDLLFPAGRQETDPPKP